MPQTAAPHKFSHITNNYDAISIHGEFHKILALLLLPPYCICDAPCLCKDKRERIVLSLNVNLYNQAYKANLEPNILRFIWKSLMITFFERIMVRFILYGSFGRIFNGTRKKIILNVWNV